MVSCYAHAGYWCDFCCRAPAA